MSNILELGDNHSLRFVSWEPDMSIPANAERYKDLTFPSKAGAILTHITPSGDLCDGVIMFDLPGIKEYFKHPVWKVESWDPLTLSPSILCNCGDHGYIRNGKWERC